MENEKIEPPPCHISRWTNAWNTLAIEVAKPYLNPKWIPDEKVIAEAEAELNALREEGKRKGVNPAWLD